MIESTIDLGHVQLAGLHFNQNAGLFHGSAATGSVSDTAENPVQPQILALHGWLDNAHSFLPLAPHLQQQLPNTPWLALDFAGHGHSGHRSAGSWYYFVDYVADIVSYLERYDVRNIHLVGHSMGGYVAQMVAAVCPERIAKLTLIEAFGLWIATEGTLVDHLRSAVTDRLRLAQKQPPVYADIAKVVALRAEKSELSEALARLIVERNMQPVEGGFSWRLDPKVRLASAFRFTEAHAVDMLKRIQCNVQLILGDQGTPALSKAVATWGKYVPQLAVTRLGGGHHVHMQQPQQVAELIVNLR